jgi:hypothetical protein
MHEQHWQLELQVKVREVSPDGSYSGFSSNNTLEIRQELTIGTGNFLDVCGQLGRIEALARELKLPPEASGE